MKKLNSQVLSIKDLTDSIKNSMYKLYSTYYEGATETLFYKDLQSKHDVIILIDADNNLKGFTTIQIIETSFNGQKIQVIFSGDTIIHHEFWGGQTLPLAWCKYAGKKKAAQPDNPLYWLLITKGHRTYRFLPIFFKNFHPKRGVSISFYQEVLDFLAAKKFKDVYDALSGTLRYSTSQGHLKPEWADAENYLNRHKEVEFFLLKNPDYAKGAELVCIAELCEDNLKSFALKGFKQGLVAKNE